MSDSLSEIRRRIDEFQRTADLAALWPDVAPADLREAHARIRAVTEAMLRPSAERPSLGGTDERALSVAAFMSGMGALLGWWVEQGQVDAPAGTREVLARHLDQGRRRSARLHAELGRIVRAMRAHGVDPVILKGLHTGAIYFPHPATRPSADIDLLVRPAERVAAVAALIGAGFVESRHTRYAARSEWVPDGPPQHVHSLELEHADNPWSVDLHTALERWYFRGLRRGLGAPPSDPITIGDERMGALAQPYLSAFLAMHASHELVKIRLVRLVELALVLRTDLERGRLDWGELTSLLRATRTERFVHPALALTEELAPGTVPHTVLERLARASSTRAHRVIAAVRAANLAPLTHKSLDAKLMWASGPRELIMNVSELLVPSDDGMPLAPVQLHWQRLQALWRGRAGWRARQDADW